MCRCELKCFAMEAFPLRVCKAITGHKSQGMTIAVGEPFESVVLHYPETGTRVPPGLQTVMTSRPKGLENFCIGNKVSDLDKGGLKKIGKSTSDSKRRVYQAELKQIYRQTNGRVKGEIGALDPNGRNSYEDGCKFLLHWYRNTFWAPEH